VPGSDIIVQRKDQIRTQVFNFIGLEFQHFPDQGK
jgi:hypothetical protein